MDNMDNILAIPAVRRELRRLRSGLGVCIFPISVPYSRPYSHGSKYPSISGHSLITQLSQEDIYDNESFI